MIKVIACTNYIEASRGAGAQSVIKSTHVRFPLEEIKYLFRFIFSFLRYGAEVKRGVE